MSGMIGIVSDTHGLLRGEVAARLQGCGLILHAGDVGGQEVLEKLRGIAPVTAVRGNTDPRGGPLRETECVEYEGRHIFVLHDIARLDIDPEAAGVDLVVYGHSHRPFVRREGGVLYLNPGSAGPRRFGLPIAMAFVSTEGGLLVPELVTLSGQERG